MQPRVQQILDTVDRLRPIPSSVSRILKEIDSPYTTVSIIAEYIGLDQALAAQVLQVANSVTMGYTRTCNTIREGVMRIGLKRLKSILLASNAVSSMQNQKLAGYNLGAGELWNHSTTTAIVCEKVAREVNYSDPEEAYVAGLLHDVGKLILDQFVLNDYTRIILFKQQYKLTLWQVEDKLIGINHARVGGLIGERWSFPPHLVESIYFHHYPGQAKENQLLPAIVNLGNSITTLRFQSQNELFSGQLNPDTLSILKLSQNRLESITKTVVESIS
jgi:putative nucleotidyltransferase with HDIG domain